MINNTPIYKWVTARPRGKINTETYQQKSKLYLIRVYPVCRFIPV